MSCSTALKLDDASSSVAILLRYCRPATVSGFVVAVVVNAVEG